MHTLDGLIEVNSWTAIALLDCWCRGVGVG